MNSTGESHFCQVKEVIAQLSDIFAKQEEAGVVQTLFRLAEQDISLEVFQSPLPQIKPVTRYLPFALELASRYDAPLTQAIGQIAPYFRWVQGESYTDEVLGAGFSQNYAWTELIGEESFFPGTDFKLGFLLLGPDRHYLDHYHPAPELYCPLTPGSEWKKGIEPFMARAAGELIWHPSMMVHATITRQYPLLAIYAWTQNVRQAARLCANDQ